MGEGHVLPSPGHSFLCKIQVCICVHASIRVYFVLDWDVSYINSMLAWKNRFTGV